MMRLRDTGLTLAKMSESISAPPTDDDPLLITTPEGRVISCAVRSLGRRRPHRRWVFVTALRDSNGFLVLSGFVRPLYLKGEHDDIDAIRTLVFKWWRVQERSEQSHPEFAQPFRGSF